MVEAKLEALVNRLEAAVARLEGAGGGAGAAATGGAPSSALAQTFAKATKAHVTELLAKTADCGNEYVTTMTGTYVRLIYSQAQVLNTMARF